MDNVQENQLKTLDVPPEERITQTKTIYEVSGFEVFWRNLLAGFSRALGGIILYFFIFFILASLINRFLLPHILPLVSTLKDSVESLNQINSFNKPNPANDIFKQQDLQNVLNKIQK